MLWLYFLNFIYILSRCSVSCSPVILMLYHRFTVWLTTKFWRFFSVVLTDAFWEKVRCVFWRFLSIYLSIWLIGTLLLMTFYLAVNRLRRGISGSLFLVFLEEGLFYSFGMSFLTTCLASFSECCFSKADISAGALEILEMSSLCRRPALTSSLPSGVLKSTESRFKSNTRFCFAASFDILSKSTSWSICSKDSG